MRIRSTQRQSRTRLGAAVPLFCLALATAGCPLRGPIPAKSSKAVAGVRLDRTPRTDKAMRLEGVQGDIVLANSRLFAVVSAAPAAHGYRRLPGRLLDLRSREAVDDLLQSLGPALRIGEERARVEVTGVSADPSGVIVVADVSGHAQLGLRTLFRLGGADGHVEVETTLTNAGPGPVDVTAGDEIYLGNIVPFVPGHGDVRDSAELSAHWFGFATRGQAFAYGKAGGEAFDVKVPYLTIGDSPFTGALRTTLVRGRVSAGGTLSWRRWATTGRSLAEASEALFAAARTTVRTLSGVVRDMRPGITVEAMSAGKPFSRVTPDREGAFSLALPPGTFQLEAVDSAGLRGAALPASPDRQGDHLLDPPETGTLMYRVLAESGGPLACRLVFIGPNDRRRTVYTASGEGEIRLSPGQWRVLAARGFEYEIAERTVEVRSGPSPQRVDLAPRHVVKTRGWVSADLHLHAEGSGDSEARFSDRVRSLAAEGIEVAVATDHNRVSDYGPAVRQLGLQDQIRVLSGAEVSTTGALRWGHFNAFPLTKTPPHHDTDPSRLFAAIRQGGDRVIQVNHPRMPPRIGYFDLAQLDTTTGKSAVEAWSDDFDVIEVFNGIWLPFPDRVRRNLDDWFGLLNRGLHVAASGNSDSHKLVEQEVGWPRTYIQTGEDDPGQLTDDTVISALRAGRTLVTSGPFIRMTVDGKGPGEVVRPGARTTLPLEVWVHAPTWVPVRSATIIVDGKEVWKLPVPPASSPLRLHGRFDVRVDGARWIIVMVDGGNHTSPAAPVDNAWSVAFTSPVYVDHATASPLHSLTDFHAQIRR